MPFKFGASPAASLRSLPTTRSPSPAPLFPASDSLAPATLLERHPQFYIDDEMAVLLVEGCLFRVHRFFLDRESKIFPKASGLGNGSEVIELESGVTRFEFESLLNFIYNGMHTNKTISRAEWTAILSISTRFEMANVRSRAIAEVDKFRSTIDPIDQVLLAVTHDVPAWLPDAYVALCLRETPITLQEMKRLGDETTILVGEAREAILRAKLKSKDTPRGCSNCCSANGEVTVGSTSITENKPEPPLSDNSLAHRIVHEVFWREQRERKRLENETKQREVKQAKAKAAFQLLELEKALGGSENLYTDLDGVPDGVRGIGVAVGLGKSGKKNKSKKQGSTTIACGPN